MTPPAVPRTGRGRLVSAALTLGGIALWDPPPGGAAPPARDLRAPAGPPLLLAAGGGGGLVDPAPGRRGAVDLVSRRARRPARAAGSGVGGRRGAARPRRDGGDRRAGRLHAVELPVDRVGDGARRRVGRRQPDAAVPHRVRALRAAALAAV